VRDGKALKAIHFGGAMGGSIPADLIDAQLDFDEMSKLGAPIGAGGLLLMDEDTDMVEVARYLLDFLVNESCGKCVPCREGMPQMLHILTGLTQGKGRPGDLERLEDLAEVTGLASLCALGKTSADPLKSMFRYFKPEIESRIPAGSAGQ
jgi:NADH-quinone oxidoreductase subunit F